MYNCLLCHFKRYNLKIFHKIIRFKNDVVTPVRADIFCSLRLTNPSLQGLPLELLIKIKQFLNENDFKGLMVALQV